MAKLMEVGVHPVVTWADVTQNAHIAFAVNVNAIGMLVFARLFIHIAVGKHIIYFEANAMVKFAGNFYDVLVCIIFVEVNLINAWRFLKKAVLIMPGHQFVFLDPESVGQMCINIIFEIGKCITCKYIEFIKKVVHIFRLLIIQFQAHGMVIFKTEFPGNFVTKPCQLFYVFAHQWANIFVRKPGFFQQSIIGRGF